MAFKKTSGIKTWMFLILVLSTILAVSCAGEDNSTSTDDPSLLEEDDDDFDFSVFDKTEQQRKMESEGKLADSIIKAVKSFKRENNQFSIASLFSGGGLAGLFGFPSVSKRSIPDSMSADPNDPQSRPEMVTGDKHNRSNDKVTGAKDEQFKQKDELSDEFDTNDQSDEELLNFDSFSNNDSSDEPSLSVKRNEEDTAVFKQLNEDLRKEMAVKIVEHTTPSHINKIPKRTAILSRRPKSLNDIHIKSDQRVPAFSTEDADIDKFLSADNLKNSTGIEKFLEVYSARRLLESWKDVRKAVTRTCGHQLGQYLVGLTKRELWALKMDDASGRYTTGYFWGNAYWTGSSDLCGHIADVTDEAPTSRPSTHNGGHSEAHGGHSIELDTEHGAPPYLPAFFMAKLQLNESLAHGGPRVIHLGLCLPANCSARDVQAVLESARASSGPLVLGVRAPHHQRFDMFTDRTFQILAVVSVVVLALMIAGSLYELALGPRLQQTHHAAPVPALAPLALPTLSGKMEGIPQVKMANGKSVYSLNNSISNNNNNNSEERLHIEMPPAEEATQMNIFSELILSFSVISNMKTICDQTVGNDTIPTIHGLRSISMAWVILGHACIVAFKYADNTELRKEVEKEFLFQTVTNGAFSVDTFFCISGILVSYIYFRTNAKGSLERLTQGTKGLTSGVLQFIGLLAYRFARLTAPYMFMLGVVEVSMKWFYYNSVFEPPTLDHVNCPDYWWRNVLYINTLFPVEEMCMLWSWYLADDSQFYVVGAVILILAASHFKTAAVTLTLFLVSSWFTTGYIAWSNNHMPSTDDPLALFDKIYDKPWTRLGPYLVGMAAGWLLFKTNCRIRMSKIVVAAGWFLSTLTLLCLIYGLYNTQLSPLAAAAYSSLSHTTWAFAVAWIVIACSTGYGGYINTLLSATILYPFSRVTYCAYLVHPVVIRYLAMHMDHPFHLGKSMMAIIFFGQMMASFLLSFLISLAFEAPVVTMLKILAPNRRKKLQ